LNSDLAARSLPLMPETIRQAVLREDKGAPGLFKTEPFQFDDYQPTTIFSASRQYNPRLLATSGIVNDAIMSCNNNDAYLVHQIGQEASYRLHRLSTTVSIDLQSTIGRAGIDGLLSLHTQGNLHETSWILPSSTTLLASGSRDPFGGAYGSYI